MSEQREFLRRLIDLLDQAQIPYMVAGSLASSFHGNPRATNDVDLVIAPTEAQFRHFLDSLSDDCYVSREAAFGAFSRESAFNVIDTRTQWKADLRVRQNRPFSMEEFERRRKAVVLDTDVWMVSAEDVILSKLEWAGQSESRQQLQDVLGVMRVQYEHLDREYLLRWADELGVRDRLIELLERAEERGKQYEHDF